MMFTSPMNEMQHDPFFILSQARYYFTEMQKAASDAKLAS